MATASVIDLRIESTRALFESAQQHLIGARDIMPLAFAVFQQDQFEKRIDPDLVFYPGGGRYEITPEQRIAILDRAAVAMTLGDPLKRDLMVDYGALAILRGGMRGLADGTIPNTSPLARLDLTTARVIAEFAITAALAFAAGHPADVAKQLGGNHATANREDNNMAENDDPTTDAPVEEQKTDEPKPVDQGDGGGNAPAQEGEPANG